jgi:branched-chain amino acid transport system substrate-binding protein
MIKVTRFSILGKDIFVCLIAIVWLSACTGIGAGDTPATIKIGLIAPFEGLHRPLGYEALFGVKLALQERNLTEGVAGYRVELVALNDFDDPVEAERQARALMADPDVVGVVGHLSAATTQAALPVYQAAEVAVVIPWSVAGGAEIERAGVVRVAADVAATTARLETTGRDMGYSRMTGLVNSQLDAIPANAEALTLSTEGVTAGEMLIALRRAGMTLPVFGQVDAGSPQLVSVAQTAANGFIFVSPGPDPAQLDEAASFVEAYQALAGFPPGPRAVLAYDATQVLLEAIEQSLTHQPPPARAAVSAAIGTVQWPGVSGAIAFDQHGGRVNAPIWVYQIAHETYPGVLLSP